MLNKNIVLADARDSSCALRSASRVFILKNLFLIVILLVSLVGCQGSDSSQNGKIDDVPLDRRIGVIKSLGGAKTSSNGTHLLQLDDGETILLNSLVINLDEEKYSGVTVEVRGILVYTKGNKPLMTAQNIDILDDYVPADKKSLRWEDFDSSKFGFSIKYRSDFDVKESDFTVSFEIKADDDEADEELDPEEVSDSDVVDAQINTVSVTSEAKGEDEDILKYLGLDSDSATDLLDQGMTKSKVGTQSLSAFKKVSSDNTMITFYIDGDSYFYTIRFEGGHGDTLNSENLFFEMLGTFALMGQPTEGIEDFSDLDSGALESRTVSDDLFDDGDYLDELVEDVEALPADDTDDSEADDTVAEVKGYTTFESDSFDFTMQYPSSWYFAGSASSEAGVIRHYEFGDDPIDETAGDVYLDLVSIGAAAGESVTFGGTKLTKVKDGSTLNIYYEGDSRIYRVSGPSSKESILLQMAASVAESG